MNYNKLSNMAGRSMIEMLGVLAIIGVLSVGGIAAFSQMLERYKITQTYEQINAIAAKLSAVGSEAASYDGLSNKAAIKFGAIPKEAIVNANTGKLENLFHGDIIIMPSNMSYIIFYRGLPRDACIYLATQDWGTKSSTFNKIGVTSIAGFQQILLPAMHADREDEQGEVRDNAYAILPANKTPMSPIDAAKGCSCSTYNTCIVALKFN
mgnify:CR=1 FL=1